MLAAHCMATARKADVESIVASGMRAAYIAKEPCMLRETRRVKYVVSR
jgi:hypothetical protein